MQGFMGKHQDQSEGRRKVQARDFIVVFVGGKKWMRQGNRLRVG